MAKKTGTDYQKIAADWARDNVQKPNSQAFDIQDYDLFLNEYNRETGYRQFQGRIYNEYYTFHFFPLISEEKGAPVRLMVQKLFADVTIECK